MSTDILEEPLSASYDFCDAGKTIIVTLYAQGTFEIRDVEVQMETDSLEIRTPSKSCLFRSRLFTRRSVSSGRNLGLSTLGARLL